MRPSFSLNLKGRDSVSMEKLAIQSIQKQSLTPKLAPVSPRQSSISPLLSLRSSNKKSSLFFNFNAERVISPQSATVQPPNPSLLLSHPGSQNNSPRKTIIHHSHPFFNVESEPALRTQTKMKTTMSGLKSIKTPSRAENIRSATHVMLSSHRTPQTEFDLRGYATVSSLDTSPTFWRGESTIQSPMIRDTESRGIFMINKKKYKIKAPETALFSKTSGFQERKEINFIKEQAKLQVYRKNRVISPGRKMNGIGEADILQKKRGEWTKEDEAKVDVLRRKVEIFNKFQPSLTLDERKNLYKQMILQYHPDKTKHKKEFAEEIFNYLQTNKSKFIPIL